MIVIQRLNRFYFNYDFIFNYNICDIAPYFNRLVFYHNPLLATGTNMVQPKFL